MNAADVSSIEPTHTNATTKKKNGDSCFRGGEALCVWQWEKESIIEITGSDHSS
jgi:hypothetical protein